MCRCTPRSHRSAAKASKPSSSNAVPTPADLPSCSAAQPGIVVLNDVVLNQVLVRFLDPSGREEDHDARTRAVIAEVQQDGTCWLGGSTWRNQAVMRISVSNHATTDADVTASVAAIIAASR